MAVAIPAFATGNSNNSQGDTNAYGGAGGAGGSAVSTSGAQALAGANASAGVIGSGNSSNHIRNSVSNRNSNSQGQGQSQSANNHQSQAAKGGNANQSLNGGANNSSQTVGGDTYSSDYRASASGAYAGTIYPTSPCMGGTSVGGQGMSFGFSVGTSWKDDDCNVRENVRTVSQVLNDPTTAAEMLCAANPVYAEARKRLGKPCAGVQSTSGKQADVTPVEYRDPIIRARLGLAPLE